MKLRLRKKPSISIEKTLEKVKVETYLEQGRIQRVSSPLPPNAIILDRYQAGYNQMATVTIYQDQDTENYVYHVEEPPVSNVVKNLYKQVRERLQSMEIEIPEKLTERELMYEKYIQEALRELGVEEAYVKYPELRYYIIRDVVGWRIIDVPMRDPRVEELDYSSSQGTLSVVVKHEKVVATWIDTNITLPEDELNDLIEFMAFRSGKPISVANPLLEARTPEGYRLAANLKEVGLSPAFTIRKFPEMPLSITKLISYGTLSPLMAAYLWTLVENLRFVMIIGAMASGKTTMLQALTSVIPRDMKVTTIEDTPELRLAHPRWQPLYTRRSTYGTEQDITLFHLARYALRTRAQYVIIGEVRDREIQTLVQMASSGHGSLCLHGNELVRVRINGDTKDMAIGELVDKTLRKELKGVEVLSINLKNKKLEWKKLAKVYKVPASEWVVIRTSSGASIKATPDHRFPLASGRFARADELRVGDELVGLSSGAVVADEVADVEKIKLGEQEWSYDIEVEGNHTFLVNGKIFSANCTFHAEDPETLFLRMTSPPLSVQPSFILTIAAVVLQARVWSKMHGTYIRRTMKIWEITGIKPAVREGEIPVVYKPVFVWDPAEDRHYPDNPEDLLKESKHLKIIGVSKYGEEDWDSMMLWELKEKTKFMEELVRERVFDFKEVTERIYRKSIEFKKRKV